MSDLSSITADMTVTAVYTKNAPPDNTDATDPTEKPAKPGTPATGDDTSLLFFVVLTLLSGSGLAILMPAQKKKQKR